MGATKSVRSPPRLINHFAWDPLWPVQNRLITSKPVIYGEFTFPYLKIKVKTHFSSRIHQLFTTS